jgi:hypothetical protein
MADYSFTAGSVLPGTTGADFEQGVAGAVLTAGQTVYLDTTTNTLKLTDANTSAVTAVCRGVTLNGAGIGQPVRIQRSGPYTGGGTVVVGAIYVLSETAGGIKPSADLDTGDWVSVFGVGVSVAVINIQINNSGVQVPAP